MNKQLLEARKQNRSWVGAYPSVTSLLGLAVVFTCFTGCTKSCSRNGTHEEHRGTQQKPKDEKPSYAGISVNRIVKRDLAPGSGATVNPTSTISYKQTTWIYDTKKPANRGKLVSGGQDVAESVKLGSSQLVRGIEQGVLGMKKGGKRQLIIPPEYAYGDKGLEPDIFPGAILLVDIEILDVK